MVTHEPDMAEYADRLIHFLDGQIETDALNADAGTRGKEAATDAV